MIKRGIIIHGLFFHSQGDISVGGCLDPTDLRKALLYWDRIEFPLNSLLRTTNSPNVSLLIQEGILQRTDIAIQGPCEFVKSFALVQAKAFINHNKEEPGLWSMLQNVPNFIFPDKLSAKKQSVEIELYGCLPLPSEDIPIYEILQFKEKRKDELLSFRTKMDELYLYIINSKDVPRSKVKVIQDIEMVIKNLNEVLDETWKSRLLLSSYKVEINYNFNINEAPHRNLWAN